ncbi:MAG: acyltransferase [Bacteroidetes bacterium]|nr:acyltransferase [Bacteroidota bacterium]
MSFITANKNRVLGLDMVRSIAILLVVYTHGAYLLPKSVKHYYMMPKPSIDGVSIFFVLSGFLIGTILLKIIDRSQFTKQDLINFWIRRWFRTLPNYFLVLFLLVLYQVFIIGNLGSFNFTYLFFFQNFAGPHPQFFPEAWSLCVEEWFYLTFPLVCFFLFRVLKNKNKSILISAIFFITIPLIVRIIAYALQIGLDDWDANYRKVVIFRLDSIMYGVIGAYVSYFHKTFWLRWKKPGIVLAVLLILYLSMPYRWGFKGIVFFTIYQYNIESLATLLMLPFFSQIKSSNSKPVLFFFTFISLISYSMYLLNYTPVLKILIPSTLSILGLTNNTSIFVYIFSYTLYWCYIILGSYLLYKYYEKPMMGIRDKIRIGK